MPLHPAVLLCGAGIVFVVLLILVARQTMRRERAIKARLDQIREVEQTLLILDNYNSRVQVTGVGEQSRRWWRGVIAITGRELLLYDRTDKLNERQRFALSDLRWFGRPQKYTSGHNIIWLHFEAADGWRILRIRLFTDAMRDLVRMLKTVVEPELVTAYRRRRPYVLVGLVSAYPAIQDIHGAWSVGEGIHLYLMPRYLVILEGDTVLRKIALEGLQRIGALRRIDQPGADGLVRFEAEEETFAFALKEYETFAGQLAEAAKRTLEAPLERKQKGKDYDDDWDE